MNALSWQQPFSSPSGVGAQWLARAPRIATWLLVLALAVQAALIVANLLGARGAPATTVAAPGPTAQVATRSLDLVTLINARLFGRAEAPRSNDGANAPQTNVPLVLAGVLAADDPKKGVAIVGESAANAKVYVVGDRLPGGVRLNAVHSDRIILERAGVLESLSLPRPAGTPSAAPAPLPTAATPAPFERLRKLVQDDPSLVANIMRTTPVFKAGNKMSGVRVYPGRNREAFARLGLRPGDLVTAVNGTPLDDASRSRDFNSIIGSSSQVRVSIERNGRQQDLTLDMAAIASDAGQLVGTEGMTPVNQMPQMTVDIPEPNE